MSWSSRKKQEGIFCTLYFCIFYTFRIYILLQIKRHYLIHLFTVFKIVESLQCILKTRYLRIYLDKLNLNRSRRSQMFFKIGVLKNIANFTGKHLCWSLFLIKLQAYEICEILKNTLFTEHLRWVLLS